MVCRVLGAPGGPRRWGSLACGSSAPIPRSRGRNAAVRSAAAIAPYRPVP